MTADGPAQPAQPAQPGQPVPRAGAETSAFTPTGALLLGLVLAFAGGALTGLDEDLADVLGLVLLVLGGVLTQIVVIGHGVLLALAQRDRLRR